MFCKDNKDNKGEERAKCIAKKLSDYKEMKSHNRKIGISKAKEIGLKVTDMKDTDTEELILAIHRAYMITLTASGASKVIENHKGVGRFYNLTPPPQNSN